MKLIILFTTTLLTITSNALPLDPLSDTTPVILPAERVGLIPQKETKCEIIHVESNDDAIECMYWPSNAPRWNGTDNPVVKKYKAKTVHKFNCYVKGDKVKGLKIWDYANTDGCFVPAYYTDDNCTNDYLGKCSWWVDPPKTGGD
ncbi:hypothetical protein BGZ60DRAFT_426471 [Tricladium varicosporioides]|nr:hypothetical protein BGZ60DRAFT_426471 [Hymenoscyphus varicosporioides]